MDRKDRNVNLECNLNGVRMNTPYIEFTNHPISQYLTILNQTENFIRSLQIDIRKVTKTWEDTRARRCVKFQDLHQILYFK